MKKIAFMTMVVMAMMLLFTSAGMANDWTIGFSNASVSNTWRAAYYEAWREETNNHPNVNWLYTNANDSVSQQVADVEDLLMRGVDALIISPATEDALNSVVEQAYDMGVKIVVVDRHLTTDKYHNFLTTDNYDLGRRVANRMVADLYDKYGEVKGKIAITQGYPGSGAAVRRQDGFEDILALYPGIEVVADVAANFQRSRGVSVMEDILQSHSEIDAVISHSGESLAGSIEAIIEAGRIDEIKTYAVDGYNGILKAIKQGHSEYTNFFPVALGAHQARIAVDLLEGREVADVVNVYGPDVDRHNVDDWVRMDLSDNAWVY